MTDRDAETTEDKRILYRIGVNVGDVLIEGGYTVGDGVNIAARPEGISEPRALNISGSAFDHVCGCVDAHFVELTVS
jgi:adenylate cyclase